jgi:hypothetical protein
MREWLLTLHPVGAIRVPGPQGLARQVAALS